MRKEEKKKKKKAVFISWQTNRIAVELLISLNKANDLLFSLLLVPGARGSC